MRGRLEEGTKGDNDEAVLAVTSALVKTSFMIQCENVKMLNSPTLYLLLLLLVSCCNNK